MVFVHIARLIAGPVGRADAIRWPQMPRQAKHDARLPTRGPLALRSYEPCVESLAIYADSNRQR
jgi:hypothetical protein